MIRTKIICTIGPSVNTFEQLVALCKAGMSVARLNFSHGTHDEHRATIRLLKKVREHLACPLAIMLDTKGPEIRLGKLKEGQVALTQGQKWRLSSQEILGDATAVTLIPPTIPPQLNVGNIVLFDDGYISSVVVEKLADGVVVEIQNSGSVRSGKGVNVPNARLKLPAVTEKDIQDIRFGCEEDVDIIAASFMSSAKHVLAIKKLLADNKRSDILVCAKIENHEGVEDFDKIVQVADGIMVARGDLGVEVPLSHVPRLQKMMIRKCYLAGKPVVTATQMLESMINNPRPTRAETSDVANAIYDSTSAVMLSGETAVGRYPIEAVNVMQSIIKEAEADFNYRAYFDQHVPLVYQDVPSAVTLAAVNTAYSLGAKAVFAFTGKGNTARLLSRLRPKMPIIALTSSLKSYHQMAINWGVTPLYVPENKTVREGFEKLSAYALEMRLVQKGDLVVVAAAVPFGEECPANMMMVKTVIR